MGKVMRDLRAGEANQQVSVTSIATNIIGEFNPANQNVREWIDAIDEYAIIYKWNDRTICHLALTKLRGAADVWYRGLPSRIFTWSEWKDLLIQNFVAKRNLHKLMENMVMCVAKNNQSLYEYAFEKLAHINKLKISLTDEDKVDLIMGGINNKQIQFSVETAGIKDPSKLASHFKIYDSSSMVQAGPSSGTVPRPVAASVTVGETGMRQRGTKATGLNEKRCFQCNKAGHYKRNCPEAKEQLAIEYRVNFIGTQSNAKFFKNIQLQNKETRCYIDLGSECSLISSEAANKYSLLLKPLDSAVKLSTLTGDLTPQSYTRATVSIDSVEKTIDLYIINQSIMGVDILIGQNFSEMYDIQYNKVGNSLTFSHKIDSLSFNVNKLVQTKINIGPVEPEISNKVVQLLDEFSDCTANNFSELGVTSTVEMTINVTTQMPVVKRPRQFSDSERIEIREIVQELLENGIIRESYSHYASP